MNMQMTALVASVLANLIMVAIVVYKGMAGPTAAEALAEFKAAVMKVKAAKDRSSVDAVAFGSGIPQILQILNPPVTITTTPPSA